MTSGELLELRKKYNLPIHTVASILRIRKKRVSQWHHGEIPIPDEVGNTLEQKILDYKKALDSPREVELSAASLGKIEAIVVRTVAKLFDKLIGTESSQKRSPSDDRMESYRNTVKAISTGNYRY